VILVALAMLGIVALAATVVLYVAYPHRGVDLPKLPWMSDAMRRGVAMLPTVDNLDDRHRSGHREREREGH
jgi:hypothetical protein